MGGRDRPETACGQATRWLTSITLLSLLNGALSYNNGLAQKPPLAYSNWNIVGCQVNETWYRQQVDRLVSSGLAGAGYTYAIVDDCWSNSERSSEGKLVANETNFPSGMKAIGDYIHSKGLKFGMYADAGEMTCQNHPGSLDHEEADAQSFAEWGVDYLKYDNCHAKPEDWVVSRYEAMSKALNKTGRPILYSIVGWGVGNPWEGWGQQYGNLWRTDADITQSWPEIIRVLDNTVGLAKYSRPNAWMDMDMLEVGIGALTFQEQRAHFALWALMKSPLMLSLDLNSISTDQFNLISNPEILAVNQDSLGIAGDLVWKEGPEEVYAAPLADGSRAVILLNRHTLATQYKYTNQTVNWEWIGIPRGAKAMVRNLLDKKDMGEFVGSFTSEVIVHDALMLKITPLSGKDKITNWKPWESRVYMPVDHGLSGGAIAGIVIGVVAGVLLLMGAVFFIGQWAGHRRSRFVKFDDVKAKRSPSGRLGSEV